MDGPALRALPQLHKILESQEARPLIERHPRAAVARAIRSVLEAVRNELRAGKASDGLDAGRLLAQAGELLEQERGRRLRRVINATGIVIHTNLGRAPLAEEAVQAVVEVAGGYANLEFDLDTGKRGSRHGAVETLLGAVTGAEAALAVNNNAAAVLLALGALAAGGEVIVSRGELVEIGGSFRVPDIIRESGAVLVEVGTTNKTRLADYERAITPSTRVLLKVHPSNYRISGFTAAVELADLAPLARRHGLVLMEDLGSGTLVDLATLGLPVEPTVGRSVASGADLVTFSGDKLLGGPQAGLIVGKEAVVARLRQHPLFRALRLDKLRLAALDATLRLYRDRSPDAVPVIAMLARDPAELRRQAESLAARLHAVAGVEAEIGPDTTYAGGGSLPEAAIATWIVAVRAGGLAAEDLARRLRRHEPAVVGRIAKGRLVLDPRTLLPGEIEAVAQAMAEVLACAA